MKEQEEKLKQRLADSQHRERVLMRRLTAKEQEVQDYAVSYAIRSSLLALRHFFTISHVSGSDHRVEIGAGRLRRHHRQRSHVHAGSGRQRARREAEGRTGRHAKSSRGNSKRIFGLEVHSGFKHGQKTDGQMQTAASRERRSRQNDDERPDSETRRGPRPSKKLERRSEKIPRRFV